MSEIVCSRCGLQPDRTQVGRLSAWEVAKACAFSAVLQRLGAQFEQTPFEMLGERVDDFISKQLTLEGGGNPTARAVRDVLAKCKSRAYHPGKLPENRGGRKRTYTEHQEEEAARVAMTLKAQRKKVSPAVIRATLPKKLLNPDTGKPMSDWKVRQIFQTRCYDENEDDPWQWLPCASHDYLTDAMQAARLVTGKYVLKNFAASAWRNHVAIDPCSSLLPKAQARLEEQQVAAVGKKGWRSKKSLRRAVNARAPDTAKKQGGPTVLQVHWTPVFARGKIFIYVCNPTAAQHDVSLPTKLQSWPVDALAEFLCGQDLCGPAATLQKAGVNGSDFLVWTSATEIVADVNVALFTAKKLLACRAQYLGAL